MLESLRKFDKNEVAKQRLKIINFYQKCGEKATQEAFGVDRKLIYVWRKKMETAEDKLLGLVPESTQPRDSEE